MLSNVYVLVFLHISFLYILSVNGAVIQLPSNLLPSTSQNHNRPVFPFWTPSSPPNITTSPSLTFLDDIKCNHLSRQDDFVDREACGHLFDKIFRYSDVYEERSVYNGYELRDIDQCSIRVYKPERGGRTMVSLAQMVVRAIAVLDECKTGGTGGAFVFDGEWRAAVSKRPNR